MQATSSELLYRHRPRLVDRIDTLIDKIGVLGVASELIGEQPTNMNGFTYRDSWLCKAFCDLYLSSVSTPETNIQL